MKAVRHKSKRIEPHALKEHVEELRREKKSIVTLNGSFDLLTAGHLFILYEAAKQADVLIVACNSDTSIRGYKDEKRPIIPLKERLELLASLECVDYVTWFDELDPRAILSIIKPDVHVNGAEYGENCIEAETVQAHGGKIVLVERIPHLATSKIIEKIKTL